jgi:hypothetical protein
VASSAPPSPFETASGSSLSDLTPGTKAPEDPLLEFASPSEPNCVSAARASVSRRLLTQPPPAVPARDRLSWSSCSREHYLRRVPRSYPPRPQSRSRKGEDRQTPTGAVLRDLAPLDGSGRARGTHEPLAEPVVRRGAPTLRGLVSCRSRPWSRPTELSLLEEPYPLSQASCFLAGSRSTAQRRGRSEGFAAPFADRADLSPQLARGLAGLEGRDDGSLESLGAARHALPRSFTTSRLVSAGLAGLGGRHARFEALLPSRVRSHDDRSLARARSSGRCSPGLFPSPALAFRLTQSSVPSRVCSSSPVGSVCASTNVVGTNPCLVRRENKTPGHAYSPGPRSGRGV